MAVDIVIRPEGKCITVVCDSSSDRPEKLFVEEESLLGVKEGKSYLIGHLTEEMALQASVCSIAIVVVMEGPYVLATQEIPLSIYGTYGSDR